MRVDSDTQMSKIPGLFACGECAAGINGANRLGGNSLSDLLVLGKRAGEYAAKFAQEQSSHGSINNDHVEAAAKWALEPFERSGNEGPFQVQHDLQDMMQELVGIVRKEDEMVSALDGLTKLRDREKKVKVVGNREFNPGWHTAMDLHSLLTVSEAITRAAILRKESRGGHFRDDYSKKDTPKFGKVNSVISRGPGGEMQIRLEPIPPIPQELKDAYGRRRRRSPDELGIVSNRAASHSISMKAEREQRPTSSLAWRRKGGDFKSTPPRSARAWSS